MGEITRTSHCAYAEFGISIGVWSLRARISKNGRSSVHFNNEIKPNAEARDHRCWQQPTAFTWSVFAFSSIFEHRAYEKLHMGWFFHRVSSRANNRDGVRCDWNLTNYSSRQKIQHKQRDANYAISDCHEDTHVTIPALFRRNNKPYTRRMREKERSVLT
jgi:hypothetical protein